MGVLWLSTWLLVANTAIFAVSRTLADDSWRHIGLDWRPLLQQGLTATYLALLAAAAAAAVRWWRVDLLGMAARLTPLKGRQAAWAAGSLMLMAVGVALAASIGLVVVSLSW
jgi:hypothetical protein